MTYLVVTYVEIPFRTVTTDRVSKDASIYLKTVLRAIGGRLQDAPEDLQGSEIYGQYLDYARPVRCSHRSCKIGAPKVLAY